jgi:hypothetical protein
MLRLLGELHAEERGESLGVEFASSTVRTSME